MDLELIEGQVGGGESFKSDDVLKKSLESLGKLENIKIYHYGGALGEGYNITGSATLIEIKRNGETVYGLIDMGAHMGSANSHTLNSKIDFDISKLVFVIATHDHGDHYFRMPLLFKHMLSLAKEKKVDLKCEFITTHTTKEKGNIMLQDSVRIMKKEFNIQDGASEKDELLGRLSLLNKLSNQLEVGSTDKLKRHSVFRKFISDNNDFIVNSGEIVDKIIDDLLLLEEIGVNDKNDLKKLNQLTTSQISEISKKYYIISKLLFSFTPEELVERQDLPAFISDIVSNLGVEYNFQSGYDSFIALVQELASLGVRNFGDIKQLDLDGDYLNEINNKFKIFRYYFSEKRYTPESLLNSEKLKEEVTDRLKEGSLDLHSLLSIVQEISDISQSIVNEGINNYSELLEQESKLGIAEAYLNQIRLNFGGTIPVDTKDMIGNESMVRSLLTKHSRKIYDVEEKIHWIETIIEKLHILNINSESDIELKITQLINMQDMFANMMKRFNTAFFKDGLTPQDLIIQDGKINKSGVRKALQSNNNNIFSNDLPKRAQKIDDIISLLINSGLRIEQIDHLNNFDNKINRIVKGFATLKELFGGVVPDNISQLYTDKSKICSIWKLSENCYFDDEANKIKEIVKSLVKNEITNYEEFSLFKKSFTLLQRNFISLEKLLGDGLINVDDYNDLLNNRSKIDGLLSNKNKNKLKEAKAALRILVDNNIRTKDDYDSLKSKFDDVTEKFGYLMECFDLNQLPSIFDMVRNNTLDLYIKNTFSLKKSLGSELTRINLTLRRLNTNDVNRITKKELEELKSLFDDKNISEIKRMLNNFEGIRYYIRKKSVSIYDLNKEHRKLKSIVKELSDIGFDWNILQSAPNFVELTNKLPEFLSKVNYLRKLFPGYKLNDFKKIKGKLKLIVSHIKASLPVKDLDIETKELTEIISKLTMAGVNSKEDINSYFGKELRELDKVQKSLTEEIIPLFKGKTISQIKTLSRENIEEMINTKEIGNLSKDVLDVLKYLDYLSSLKIYSLDDLRKQKLKLSNIKNLYGKLMDNLKLSIPTDLKSISGNPQIISKLFQEGNLYVFQKESFEEEILYTIQYLFSKSIVDEKSIKDFENAEKEKINNLKKILELLNVIFRGKKVSEINAMSNLRFQLLKKIEGNGKGAIANLIKSNNSLYSIEDEISALEDKFSVIETNSIGDDGIISPYFYDEADLKLFNSHLKGVNYDEPLNLEFAPGSTCKLIPAGHVLGSAQVLLSLDVGNGEKFNLLFSGDLGRYNYPHPHLGKPALPDCKLNYAQYETTYGAKEFHPDPVIEEAKMIKDINGIFNPRTNPGNKVGKIIEAVLMNQRAQDRILKVIEWRKLGLIPKNTKIYIHGTNITKLNQIFARHNSVYKTIIDEGEVIFIKGKNECEEIISSKSSDPVYIFASGGMMQNGSVSASYLDTPFFQFKHNAIIFGCYQAEGTNGRMILDTPVNDKGIREIFSSNGIHSIAAQVYRYNTSGHYDLRDQGMIIHDTAFADGATLVLNHGDENAIVGAEKYLTDNGIIPNHVKLQRAVVGKVLEVFNANK